MKCARCENEMIKIGERNYICDNCNIGVISVANPKQPVYIKQEPKVDDNGIWVPYEEYVPEGTESNYRLLISKEMFVEAYNRWIKGE